MSDTTHGPEGGRPTRPTADEPAMTRLLADLVTDDVPDGEAASDAGGSASGALHPALRAAVLTAARLRAADWPLPDPAGLPGMAAPYLRQVRDVAQLAPALLAAPAGRPVVDEWTATDVVAHLVAVDALAAESLGLPTPEETGVGHDIPSRTASVQAGPAGRSIADALRVWRGQAAAIARHTQAVGEPGMAREVSYLGVGLPAGDIVLDRAFETWIHGDDLRAGLGYATRDPEASDVRRMSDLGARMLTYTWTLGDTRYAGAEALLVLTGPGGATWRVGSDGAALVPAEEAAGDGARGPLGAAVAARVVLDAVEFCRLAGGRAEPDAVRHTVDGDPRLGAHVLAATALLARP